MKFDKGLFQDTDPQNQPPGTYRDALNFEFNRHRTSLVSEQGTSDGITIVANQKVIGSVVLDDDRVILFTALDPILDQSTYPGQNDCAILIYDPVAGTIVPHTDGTYWTGSGLDFGTYPLNGSGVSFAYLNFRPDEAIQATFRINGEGETEVYWTDGFNPPRYLNLSDSLRDPNSPTEPYNNETFNLFTPIDSLPVFNLIDVKEGLGSLLTGSYQFAFAYVTKNDFSQTNWLYATNGIAVLQSMDGSLPYTGNPIDTETGVGISFEMNNLDFNYHALRVAVIKDGIDVKILPDISLAGVADTDVDSAIRFIYSGNESWIQGDLSEINVDKQVFKTAGTLAQVDGHLYLGNVHRRLDIGYQRYANNIKVEARSFNEPSDWVDKKIATPTTGQGYINFKFWRYGDPWYNFAGRSYKRGEVYALYISFVLKNGIETRAYHIPGRIIDLDNGEDEIITIDVGDGMVDKLGQHGDFQVNSRRTETVPGTPDPDSLGYWQNEHEIYNDDEDWEIWDVAAGVGSDTGDTVKSINLDSAGNVIDKVRHHRMPENAQMSKDIELSGEGGEYWSQDNPGSLAQNTNSNPLYLRFYDIKFPDEITSPNGETYLKEDVIGYKIYHAVKRAENQLILDSGSLMNGAVSSVSSSTHRHGQKDIVWDGSDVLIPHGLPARFLMDGSTDVDGVADADSTVLTSRIFYARPVKSLFDRQPVGALSFLKHVFTYRPSDGPGYIPIVDSYESNYGPGEHRRYAQPVYEEVGINYPIKAAVYAEKNQDSISLDELGLSYPMNNRYGETKVVIEVEVAPDADNYGPPGSRSDSYATGTVSIDPLATNGQISTLTVNSISIISGAVIFNAQPWSTMVDLAANINAHTSSPNYTARVYGDTVIIYADVLGVAPNGFVVAGTDTGDINLTYTVMAGGGTVTNPDDMRKWQADFCQFKQNVHLSYRDQDLAFTGYVNVSLDEDTGWQNPVPGDMFLCPHIYNAVTLWDIFSFDYFSSDEVSGLDTSAYEFLHTDWANWLETQPWISKSVYKEFRTARVDGELIPSAISDATIELRPQNPLQGRPLPMGYPVFEFVETRVNANLRHKGTASFEDWTNDARNKGEGRTRKFPIYKNVTVPDITRFESDVSDDVRELALSYNLEERDETDFLGFNPDRLRNDNLLAAARSGMIWKWPSQFWSQWMAWYDFADNYIFMNDAYNQPNLVKIAIPFDVTRPEVTDLSTRVVRSQKPVGEDAVGTWRTFLPNDFFDFSRHKGRIIRLDTFQNNLLIHFEKTLMRMGARHQLNAAGENVYLGAEDIFKTKPSDMVDATGGYAGLQDILAGAATPFGYAFFDRRKSKAFLFDGKLQELSLSGLRNYFLDNIDSVGGVTRVGFDDDYNRIFFQHVTGDDNDGNDFTVSYLPEQKIWESFHSYRPDHFIIGSSKFLTIKDDALFEHGRGRVGEYYGANYSCNLQLVDNESPELEKQITGLNLDTKLTGEFDEDIHLWGFDTFRIYSHNQDTELIYIVATNDEIILDELGDPLASAGARETHGHWRINQFRDLSHVNAASQIPLWAQRRRLSGQYHIIDLSFFNIGQRELIVHGVWLDYRRSLR